MILHILTYPTFMGPVWAVLVTLIGLPLANEIVQRARGTRAESLLQGLALFLLKLPALGIVIAKTPVLGDLLYVFAPRDKAGIPTPLIAKPSTVVVPGVEITVNTPSTPSTPSAGPGAVLALILVSSVLLVGCWKQVLRESVIELEKGHAEVTSQAQGYDQKKQEEFRDRYRASKTSEQVEEVRKDQKIYEAVRAKFADAMNKIWAVILQIKATLPLIERGTDPAARAKITAWIGEGMGWLLQGKDTLSAFGVAIGGVR